MPDALRLRRCVALLVSVLLSAICAGPSHAGWLIPGTSFSVEELLIEAREACDALRGRERRRCLREAEAEAKAQAERLAALAPVEQAYRRRLIEALATEGTARSLALAAVLGSETLFDAAGTSIDIDAMWQPDPRVPQRRDAALAASAAAGRDDPLVLRLAYAVSAGDAELQRAVLARWRAAEPDNLHPILAEADLDIALAPPLAEEKLPLPAPFFAAAVQAGRYHDHYVDLQRLAVEALRRHPPSAAELAVFLAHIADFNLDQAGLGLGVELWAAGSIVRFGPLIRSCDAGRLDMLPGRRADCRRIGRRMFDHSDTILGQLVGIALLRKTATAEHEREQARALRNQYEWRRQQMASAEIDASVWTAAQVTRLMSDGLVTEAQLLEVAMQAVGLPPEPPPAWESGYRFPDEREADERQIEEQIFEDQKDAGGGSSAASPAPENGRGDDAMTPAPCGLTASTPPTRGVDRDSPGGMNVEA